jgi:hypothetical protein
MRFYRLVDYMDVPKRWYLDGVRDARGRELDLTRGRPCSKDGLTVPLKHPGIDLDFSSTLEMEPIMRRTLADAVKRIAREDVQQIPVAIRGHSGFDVVNVVRVVDCLDETRSKFIKWVEEDGRADRLGQYRQVTRLYVDRSRVPNDANVFRIAGWVVAMVVSETVKTTMEEVGCLGATFVDVS